jgi:hypothetical protein
MGGRQYVPVLLGNGGGSFQSAVNYGAGELPDNVAIGGLDGEGDLDLALANKGSGNVSIQTYNSEEVSKL